MRRRRGEEPGEKTSGVDEAFWDRISRSGTAEGAKKTYKEKLVRPGSKLKATRICHATR